MCVCVCVCVCVCFVDCNNTHTDIQHIQIYT